MAKRSRPESVFIAGEWHDLVVFLIKDDDELDRPVNCRMILEAETVKIDGGERFMTAYIPRAMKRGRR